MLPGQGRRGLAAGRNCRRTKLKGVGAHNAQHPYAVTPIIEEAGLDPSATIRAERGDACKPTESDGRDVTVAEIQGARHATSAQIHRDPCGSQHPLMAKKHGHRLLRDVLPPLRRP